MSTSGSSDWPRRRPARRHRQGRHRQVHRRRRARAGPGQHRQERAALRGRGPPGHRPAVRRRPAALRGAPDRPRPGRRAGPRGNVYALHIDAESALLEYLAMYYRLGRAGRALDRFGVIDFATTIAPGRPRRAADRQGLRGGPQQPPQGHLEPHRSSTTRSCSTLPRPGGSPSSSTSTASSPGLAKVGPIKNQADTVMTLFRSPRTAVHLVTVLEEMPVQETADGIAQLREAELPVGGVVVNMRPAARPRQRGPGGRPGRRAGPRADRQGARHGRAGRRRRAARRACSARPTTTPSAGRSRTPSGCWSPTSGSRRTSCPGCPAASTSAASTSWPPLLKAEGMA